MEDQLSSSGKKINVIVTGGSGMVGEGVIVNAISSPEVEKILVVGRRESGIKHEKVKEIIHNDLNNLEAIKDQLIGYDSVYFCAGISSLSVDKDTYYKISYEMPMEMLNTLASINNIKSKQDNDLTFIYVTGEGTGLNSWSNWARVKAKAENDIIASNFNKTFAFRPGFIQPNIPNLKHSHKMYKYINWMYPLGRCISQNSFVTIKELGQAMINASKFGYKSNIIRGSDMVNLANKAA